MIPVIVEAVEAIGEAAEAIGEALDVVGFGPTTLRSTAISTAAWKSDTLALVMQDGTVLAIEGVPVDLYHGLVAAASPGAYFNANIRGRYG